MSRLASAAYAAARDDLARQLRAIPREAPVRLAKRTSNLFRPRARATTGLDVRAFTGVLDIDPQRRTADVAAMTTYEDLVAETLRHGFVPLVVPQLKTITLGGAVTGLGIEASSFRNGMPHESVLELEVLTGDGEIVVARPDNEHRALFYGFPNSYGTLGYALRLRIELEPVQPYVHLRHLRFSDEAALFAALGDICTAREHQGERVDFVDGTVFSAEEQYLTLGSYVATAPWTSDYTGEQIYYRSIRSRSEDFLPIADYLWRWDTDWFWCSRAFGVQNPRLRRVIPARFLRSDVYWRVVGLERRFRPKARFDRLRGRPPEEYVIQDVEIPLDRAAEFLEFFHREIPISPVWLCPLQQRDPAATWDLYALDPGTLYVNVGFWSSVPLAPGESDGTHNRMIEREVERLGGRKSLYSDSYYDEPDFWRLYNGPAYGLLKKTYDPDSRLLDLYAKCVRRR